MTDIIIITIIAVAAFFILRSQLRKFRRGQCGGGCAGCGGACGGCGGCASAADEAHSGR